MSKGRFYFLKQYHLTHDKNFLHDYYNHPEYIACYGILKRKWKLKPKVLIEVIRHRKGEKILDVGAGLRLLQPYVESCGAVYHSLDISSGFNPDILADAEKLSEFKSNAYNCIILSDVLEHLPNPGYVLKESLRVGRKVVIMVPNLYRLEALPFFPRDVFDRHLHMKSPFGWKHIVKSSGGQILSISGYYFIPSFCFNPKIFFLKRLDIIIDNLSIFHRIDHYITQKGWHKSMLKYFGQELIILCSKDKSLRC